MKEKIKEDVLRELAKRKMISIDKKFRIFKWIQPFSINIREKQKPDYLGVVLDLTISKTAKTIFADLDNMPLWKGIKNKDMREATKHVLDEIQKKRNKWCEK